MAEVCTGAGSQQNLTEEAEIETNGETEKDLLPQESETPTEDNNNVETTKDKIVEEADQETAAEDSQFGGCSVFIRDSEDEGDSVDAVPYYEDIGSKTEDDGSKTEDDGSRTEDDGSKTEDNGSKTEDNGSKTEDNGSKTEDNGSKTEDEKRTEDVVQPEEEDVVKPAVSDSESDGEEVVEEFVEINVVKENETVVQKESVEKDETADENKNEEVEESDVLNALDENVSTEINEDEMPGREDEELSSSLQRATCRYRWAKTLRTNSQDVVFFPSYKMEEPIKLTWNESSECFFSPELEVTTGIYRGNLVIDGNTYPIEDVTIKHYTFEADIYVREAILKEVHQKYLSEDEVSKSLIPEEDEVRDICQEQTGDTYQEINSEQETMERSQESPLNLSSKFENLVKKQISQESKDDESNARSSAGRRTPIGDVASEPFHDGRENGFVDDVVERPHSRSSVKSSGSVTHPSTQKTVEEIIREVNSATNSAELYRSEGWKSPLRSGENSLNGSVHVVVEDVIATQDTKSPLGSPYHSSPGSLRQTPVRESSQRSVEGSLQGSNRQTPTAGFIDDVLGQSTPVNRSEQGSARHTPQPMSNHSSSRNTPQLISDILQTSGEKLYSAGSIASDGSRPESLTSEQELNQYFEKGGSHHGSVHGSERSGSMRTPVIPSPSIKTPERPHSSSSLPVITTQQRLLTERRSMTPDNHIRVPGETSPALRGANPGANRSNVSSRASDRTLTPGALENGYTEDAQTQRINDLEDSVRNLRKLLGSREAEVHDLTNQLKQLKTLNQQLTEELDSARMREQRTSPAYSNVQELERRYNQVLSEKEIMAGEIVKLRDQMEELRIGRNGRPDGETSEMSQGISYNPNNPYALQRKIADLESQVQDLQEANETAVAELSSTERKVEELQRAKETLRLGQGSQNLDLQEENQRLHDQISKMYEKGYGGSSTDSDHRIQIEIQQLREDNRALRERNYKLHEESMQVRDELMKLKQEGLRTLPPRDVRMSPRDTRTMSPRDARTMSPRDIRTMSPREVRTPLHARGFSLEKSVELGSERISKERTVPSRMSLEQEDARLLSSIHRQTDHKYSRTEGEIRGKYRPPADRNSDIKDSDTKEDSYFGRSIQKAETRLRSSLERADANFRKIADGEDSKPRFDRFSRLSSSLDRHTDRRKYENEDMSRSESYRMGPDGGIEDREPLSATLPRHGVSRQTETEYNQLTRERSRTPDLASYNTVAIDTEWHKYDRERRLRNETTTSKSCTELSKPLYNTEPSYLEQERNAYQQDYKSNAKVTEKNREWSRSEADLRHAHYPYRGRSRTPDPGLSRRRSPSPGYMDLPSTSSYQRTNFHYDHTPRPRYDWDGRFACSYCGHHFGHGSQREEPLPLHPTSSLSERSNKTDYLTGSYHKPSNPALSIFQPSHQDKGYDVMRKSGLNQDGEESDTGTDILVNTKFQEVSSRLSPISPEPIHRRSGSHQYGYRRRRDSLGSEGSVSDEEMEKPYSKHPRSKSADGRELLRSSLSMGTERSMILMTQPIDRTVNKRNPAPPTANLRTITPGVLTTQHNRNMLAASTGSLASLTTGLKPFSPRSPGDINLEDVVKFSRAGGKLSQGTVKFVGHLPGRSDAYLGVELDREDGKHDGKFEGMRYFRCKPNKGVFVAFNKVVMAWSR
ncbi:microtubule-associated protein futsch-like isoform X5 [Ostrea edulis]|uniref:microtubule-associated protein futsch-like isoform X5 n=1 Tax=Ostrea edulis TaxID=37623 RepID=UPI0024AFAA5D|nr:microtubule-associated protein futsch-like isoform X5 [Ostrea edulis]